MSIKIMTHVWDHSAQAGTALLMLLALADHANDQGLCWPSIGTLAKRCRCSTRQAQRILRDLEAAGEIRAEIGTGRSHTTLYFLPGGVEEKPAAKPKRNSPRSKPAKPESAKGDTQRAKGDIHDTLSAESKGDTQRAKGDIQDTKGDIQREERATSSAPKGDTAMSPEPSVNRHFKPSVEPSIESSSARARADPENAIPEKPRDANLDHPAVIVYWETCHRTGNSTQRAKIAATVTDVACWQTVLDDWMMHGWRPENVADMLDRYRSGSSPGEESGGNEASRNGRAKDKVSRVIEQRARERGEIM